MAKDITVRVFDNFYNLDLSVNANEYEIVYSFFKGYTTSEDVAKSYTDTLYRISNITEINILELLKTFEAEDNMKVVLTLAYYLNSISKNKTIMYGVNEFSSPNEKIQRNILQDGGTYTSVFSFPELSEENTFVLINNGVFATLQLGQVIASMQIPATAILDGIELQTDINSVDIYTETAVTVDVNGTEAVTNVGNVSIYIGEAVWVDVSGQELSASLGEVTPIMLSMTVDFVGTVQSGIVHHKVKYNDLSSDNPVSWLWDFGDSNSFESLEQNPIAIYYFPGQYTVTLAAENIGNSNVETKTNYINVDSLPTANVKVLQVTPGYIAYDPFDLETVTDTKTLTLKNIGDTELTINYFELETQYPWYNATFTTSWTGAAEYNSFYQLPPGTTLAAGESKTMTMTWYKTEENHPTHNILSINYSGTVETVDGYFEYVELDFNRTRSMPILQIDPVQLNFELIVNTVSESQLVTLKNAGNAPLNVTNITYESDSGNLVVPVVDYANVGGSDVFTIDPYSSVTFTLNYESNTLGTYSDVIKVYSNNYYGQVVPCPVNINVLDEIPLTINWVTTQNNILGYLIPDGGWQISDQGRTIRFNVEPSENCSAGGNPYTQYGQAIATISTGNNSYMMYVNITGLGEAQDAGHENMTFNLNGTNIVTATSNDLNAGCVPDIPVSQTVLVPGPYLLAENSNNTFTLNFTTADPLYHIIAYYQLELTFYPV